MDYCVPSGIPHSTFLSWSTDDQDKAIAWLIQDRSKCHKCGTRPSEWLDEDGRQIIPPPYEANDRRCYGCAMLAQHRDMIPQDMKPSIEAYLVPYGEVDHGRTGDSRT